MIESEIKHGTYAGFMQCRKHPDGACDDCKDAQASYMREYREKHPDRAKKDQHQIGLAMKAMRILRDRHMTEYVVIYEELKAEEKAK